MQRNLPDLASSLPRLPMSPPATGASYPLIDERLPSERPPWEPRTRFEMEKDVAELKSVQRQLGDSVSWIVDTLLLDDGNTDNQDQVKSIRERKREAVECLSYVRDVLKGTVPPAQMEADRLVGEEEAKRRRAKALEKEASYTSNSTSEAANVAPALPQPAATASSSFQSHPSASTRRTQDYFTVGPSFSRGTAKLPPAQTPVQTVRARAPSPTPTISVLSPNRNAVAMSPWNHSFSSFASRESPIPTLPRLPSKPTAAATAHPSGSRITPSYPSSQTPSVDKRPRDQPPPRQQDSDPLGVLR